MQVLSPQEDTTQAHPSLIISTTWFCSRQVLCYAVTVLYDLGTLLNAGDEIDIVYLDFSKASDSVPHRRLLHKLSLFGIQGPLHAWFTDYLNSGLLWTKCSLHGYL